MSKLIKAAAAATMLMFGATALMAQQTPKTTAESGGTQVKKPSENNQATEPTDQNVGSRPMGPAKDEKPTDPNKSKDPLVKQQEKEGTKN